MILKTFHVSILMYMLAKPKYRENVKCLSMLNTVDYASVEDRVTLLCLHILAVAETCHVGKKSLALGG